MLWTEVEFLLGPKSSLALFEDNTLCSLKAAVNEPRGIEMLTKWPLLTRLETRTKESNIYASIRVANPGCAMKVNDGNAKAPSTDHDPLVKGLS